MEHPEFWDAVKFVGDWIANGGDIGSLRAVLSNGTVGSMRTGGKGHEWEQVFASMCRERGLNVSDMTKRHLPYDLVVGQDIRVQCKFISNGNRDIKPRGRDRDGVRQYKQSEFDVMAVAVDTLDRYFIIPADDMADKDGLLATSFQQRFEIWREDWSVLTERDWRRKGLLF